MELIGNVFYYQWEVDLMAALQTGMNDFLIWLANFFSIFGEQFVLVGIIAFCYFIYDKEMAKTLAIDIMTGLIWGPMIKNVAVRRRPYFDNPSISCLRPVDPSANIYDIEAQGYSFPSAHSLMGGITYPGLAVRIRKKWTAALAVCLPLLIGVSRFCLGVHYPTDVFCGLLLGLAIVFLLGFLRKKIKNNNILNIIILLTGIPGLFYCTTTDFFDGYGLLIGSVFAFIFEEKYVDFERAGSVKNAVLRLLLGLAVFLAISKGLKLVLPANMATRLIRYALAAFAALGPYTLLFEKFKI